MKSIPLTFFPLGSWQWFRHSYSFPQKKGGGGKSLVLWHRAACSSLPSCGGAACSSSVPPPRAAGALCCQSAPPRQTSSRASCCVLYAKVSRGTAGRDGKLVVAVRERKHTAPVHSAETEPQLWKLSWGLRSGCIARTVTCDCSTRSCKCSEPPSAVCCASTCRWAAGCFWGAHFDLGQLMNSLS